MLFQWGCPYLCFLIYNTNSTSSHTLTYSNLFLFTTASFHFLIYNINSTSSPTLVYSNIFLFTTSCFAPMWLVLIWIWFGSVTCCSFYSGSLIHKTGFFLEKAYIYLPLFYFWPFSLFSSSIYAALCFLHLIFYDCIYQNTYFT